MHALHGLIGVLILSLAGCKEDCPPCHEPKTFPINFGGDCVKTTTDPTCPAYTSRTPADTTLSPAALCHNTVSGDELMGVWESRPIVYGQWLGEVRTIRRSQGGFATKDSTLHLCPDLRPGYRLESRTAIDGPARIRVNSWGYSLELNRYWVTGAVVQD